MPKYLHHETLELEYLELQDVIGLFLAQVGTFPVTFGSSAPDTLSGGSDAQGIPSLGVALLAEATVQSRICWYGRREHACQCPLTCSVAVPRATKASQ